VDVHLCYRRFIADLNAGDEMPAQSGVDEPLNIPEFLGPFESVDLSDGMAGAIRSVFSAIVRLAPGPATQGRLKSDFFMEKQTQTNWCWAAVGLAVNRFFEKPATTQCSLAQRTLQPVGVNCCQSPGSSQCNVNQRISAVLAVVGVTRLGDPAQPQSPVGMDIIQRDIGRNRPIICAMSGGGTNHFVVVVAWALVSGAFYVFVDDPAAGTRKERTFTAFQTNFEGRSWIQTTRLQ
jgi:hypothetical protein